MNDLIRALLFLPPQASSWAAELDTLHFVVLLSALAGASLVGLAAVGFLVRYRRGTPASRARHQSLWFEAVLIVMTLGLFVGFWVVGFRQYARMADSPPGAMVVHVTGKQWMWKFTHDQGSRDEIDVLHVPAGRPVRLVMTSRDVIHSFFVPAFRLKKDVLPGRYTTAWFQATEPGTYPIYCAELCGVSHSLMAGRVEVLSPEAYAAWLGEGGRAESSLAERGREVAARRQCLACHTLDGKRHVGPTWKGLYGAEVTLRDGRKVVADEAYLTRSMMEPGADLVSGFDPVMPAYAGQLPAPEVAALLELIRSLREPAPPGPAPYNAVALSASAPAPSASAPAPSAVAPSASAPAPSASASAAAPSAPMPVPPGSTQTPQGP